MKLLATSSAGQDVLWTFTSTDNYTATAEAVSAARQLRDPHSSANKLPGGAARERALGHRRSCTPGPPPLSARSSPPARRCPAAPQGWRGEGTRRGRPSSRPSPGPRAAAPPPGVSPGPGTTAGTGGAATVAAALPGPALGERAAPAELGHEVSGAGVRGRAGGAPPSRSDVGALGGAGSPLRAGRWGAGAEHWGCRTGPAAA